MFEFKETVQKTIKTIRIVPPNANMCSTLSLMTNYVFEMS
jgi:hypothetical protein